MNGTVLQQELHHANSGYTPSNTSSFTNHTEQASIFPSDVFIPCNNPQNVVSPHVADMADLVLYAGIFPVLVICGVVTNVINMAVFARQGLSDRINLCLFSLAVSDTGYLLFLMCGKSYAAISLVDPAVGIYWQNGHHGPVLASYLGFLVISNVTTAVIAVERCLCVLCPLKVASIFRTKHLGVLLVAVTVYIQTVLNTAITLQYQTIEATDSVTNTSTFISRLSPFYLRHRTIIDILYNYIILLALPFLSLVVVVVCTAIIIFHLKVTATWRRQAVSNVTSVEKKDVTLTRMLVTVCVVYVTCMTPTVTRSLVISSRVPGFMMTDYLCNLFKLFLALSHLFAVVNASSNFFIYIRQSSRYRSTLRQICCNLSNQWSARKGGNN